MPVTGLLDEIAGIGRNGATGGYNRFAFTPDDAALGEWFAAACAARGFEVTTDRCGNQWAWDGDPDAAQAAGRPGVVIGSHLDSVPDGGAFDGPLGVASAFAAVDALRAAGTVLDRPLGLVRFVDEEGARFGLACSGSRLITGTSAPDAVLALRDAAGTSYAEALGATGVDVQHAGRDADVLHRIGVFVELHVEQGRMLAQEPYQNPIGVAAAIKAHGRWRVDLPGRADHAGATLMQDRDDPMLALARLIPAVREAVLRHDALAGSGRGGTVGTVGTVGKVAVRPNAVNAIPSLVQAWLDVRSFEQDVVRAVVAELAASFPVVEESWTPTIVFDSALAERLSAALGGAPVIPTGAGHDAGILADAGIPAGMLFVRNPTGVSHSPAEHAEPDDCEGGVRALAAVVADLCGASPATRRPATQAEPGGYRAGEGAEGGSPL